ncbi:uncharacterized protein PRCAT00004726001 [Priceomyces carsonii]|uniref:uncharacterized protein n=1 Tax=Priceomyces carsonii TaxID=28549 RepID=UPI002ED7AD60|nr:unnamed protein product [Priceomyces carsonii]
MSAKKKFLIANPYLGNLDEVIRKINLQNTKNGPFEAVLLLGDVLPTGSKLPLEDLDVTTYFTEGRCGISESLSVRSTELTAVEVKPHLFYLSSIINIIVLPSGLTLAYVSAKVEEDNKKLEAALDQFKKSEKDIDILVTYDWPRAIAREHRLTLIGNVSIDTIVKEAKPRYHFAVGSDSGRFVEGAPFEWDNGRVTRFISLGQEGSGEKWFYGFGMSNVPSDVSESLLVPNPFIKSTTTSAQVKRSFEEVADGGEAPVKQIKIVPMEKCFFCLSNPNVETHMVISIGKHSYLTVAKGPLSRANKNMQFSGHAIIIPIEHIPSIRSTTANVQETPVYKEIQKFEQTLVQAFQKLYPSYRLVFFEINRLEGVHYHVQMVPVLDSSLPKFAKILKDKAKTNNEVYTQNQHLDFSHFSDDKSPELLNIINHKDHILFTVYRNETQKDIYIATLDDESKTVDLQFPRRVLATVINRPKSVSWVKCRQPSSQEAAECLAFKKFYQEFDFTL